MYYMDKEGQSMEKDRMKKRADPGGEPSSRSKVSELMKERKRKVAVSESESEETADEKETSLASRKWNAVERSSRVESKAEKKKGVESKSDRKRSREVSEDQNVTKRSKMVGAGENKMKASNSELGNDGKMSEGDRILPRKPVVPAYRLREATIQGIVLSSVEGSTGRLVGEKGEDPRVCKQEVIRVQGRGGVLRILSNNKKAAGLQKVKNKREDVEYGNHEKVLTGNDQTSLFKQTRLPGEMRVTDKSNSDAISDKGQSSMEKNSVSDKIRLHQVKEGKNRPHEARVEEVRPHQVKDENTQSPEAKAEKVRVHMDKAENRSCDPKARKVRISDSKAEKFRSTDPKPLKFRSTETKAEKVRSREAKAEKSSLREVKISQVKSNVVELSNVSSSLKLKVEGCSSSRTPLIDKETTRGARGRRNTVKRKLREEIKTVLLNAGWKIDLRPRRGRDYEDAVYVSPEGTGYWSITKAYAVFQEQVKGMLDDNGKVLPGNSSRFSSGTPPYSAIPMEALHMLKRNVKKRRRKEEIEDSRKKEGLGRKKKKKGKDAAGRRKVISLMDSNVKGYVTSTSHKPHSQSNDKKQRGCALLVRGANLDADACFDEYVPYAWKRTVLSWMIDLGIVPANGKVKYMNKKKTRTMLEGRITRDGINCGCCSKVLTVSRFEVHAGSKLNQPYENIYVEETGISLLQSQLNAWEKHEEAERRGFYTIPNAGDDPSDDTCGICGDGGDLICCDSCPSTFHLSCLGIQMLPPGDWHCMYCSCKYCRRPYVATAAEDGSTSVPSLLCCSQCGEKYHQECVPESDAVPVGSNKIQSSFCGRRCRKVFKGLQKLVGVKNELEGGFSWSLIHNLDQDSTNLNCALPLRAICNSKIAVAFAVMDECFLPIIDQRSGINLIHNIIYGCGSNFKRLNYSGFHTFVLERGDEIICVASVRVHGTRLAEMPFIGTRNMYRRQGMCRRLLNGIEAALRLLNVEKLIVPAISNLSKSWTTAFGFKPSQISQKQEIRSINMLVFPSTGLLEKVLLKRKSDGQLLNGNGATVAKSEIRHHNISEGANESSSSPSVCMGTHLSDMAIVTPKHDSKEPKHTLPALDGRVGSAQEATLKSCDTSYESYSSSGGHTHSESVADAKTSLSPHPDEVCGDKHLTEENFQVDVSSKHQLKSPSDVSLCDNNTLKMEDADGVDDTKAPCTGNNLHTSVCSLDSSTVGIRNDGPEAVNRISSLPADGDIGSNSEYILDANPDEKCQVAITGTNDTNPDVISGPLDDNGNFLLGACALEAANRISSLPADGDIGSNGEYILDANPDEKCQVAITGTNNTLVHFNPDVISGPLDDNGNSRLGACAEPDVQLVDDSTVHITHEVKLDVASLENKLNVNVGDTRENMSDIIKGVSSDSPGKEIQASSKIDQQDLQLLQKQPEVTLGSCSETSMAVGFSERIPFGSNEKSTTNPTIEIAGGTQDVAPAPKISSQVPGTRIDTQSLKCGKTLSTPENHAVSEADGNVAFDHTTALHFVLSDGGDATSLGSLNKPPQSTSVAVQSDLTSNVSTIVAPTGMSLDCKQDIILAVIPNDLKGGDEAKTSRTGDGVGALKEGDVHSLKPVEDHGTSATYSTSDVVEESLNNVSVMQHDSSSTDVPNNLAFCPATSSADGVNSSEKNEMVSGCKQATCLGSGHNFAD